MRAVVMAGGQGARLAPYTTVLPKPLLPVGDRPVLAIVLEQLAAAGATRIDVCLGHLAELVRAYLADAALALDGAQVVLHHEREPLGTAGALRSIPDLDEPFVALNGDVLTALDPAALLREHVRSGAALTIATQQRETTIPAGVLEVEGDAVTSWAEKPTLRHEISLGIYAVAPRALAHLGPGRVDLPDLAAALLAAAEPVRRSRYDGPWFDIGTRADHEAAAAAVAAAPERFLRPR